MKILLLGATGRTGQYVLKEALEKGFFVKAITRSPEKLIIHDRLKVIKGNALNIEDIKNNINDCDAVISVLGHKKLSDVDVLYKSSKLILEFLKPNQRYICLTGFGVKSKNDIKETLSGTLLNIIIKLLPSKVWEDANKMGKYIQESDKNWILVRAPRIVNGAKTSFYKKGYIKVYGWDKVNAGNIADFMISSIYSNTWLRKAPIIIN